MTRLTTKLNALKQKFGRRQRLETSPGPSPSQIYEAAANLPRSVKREHKLMVRREHRDRRFRGIVSAVERQNLGKIVLQRHREWAAEDERYAR